MIYLANAFSINMVEDGGIIEIKKIDLEQAKEILSNNSFISAIGHQSTADILKTLLDLDISMNRIAIKLQTDDTLIVFQVNQRLNEGAVLSKEEIEKLPYSFYLVRKLG